MFELTKDEITLLSHYQMLNAQKRSELQSYIEYLLYCQYQEDIERQVLGNPFLQTGLAQVYQMCQREDVNWEEVAHKIKQLKYLYYQLLEKIDSKYQEFTGSLSRDTLVRDLGRYNLTALSEALMEERRQDALSELEQIITTLQRFRSKREARSFIAV